MKKKVVIAAAVLAGAIALGGCGDSENQTSGASSVQTSHESSAQDSSSASTSTQSTSASSAAEQEAIASRVVIPETSADGIEIFEGDYVAGECVNLPEYKGLKLTKTVTPITDEQVEASVQSLVEPETVTDKNATVQMGDTVDIAYVGEINGEEFEGGTTDSYELVVGESNFIDGFQEGLVGMKDGETKDLELRFPDDYYSADLAGKPVTFHVTINEIKRTPEVTDEKVEEVTEGAYTTIEDYRQGCRDYLEVTADNEAENQLRTDAWSEVFNSTDFLRVPKEYVQKGMEDYEANITAEAANYGISVDTYLEAYGYTDEDVDDLFLEYGLTSAKRKILIEAIWEKEGFSEDEPLNKSIKQSLLEYYDTDEETLAESIGQDKIDDYCKLERICEFLVENAEITEVEGEPATSSTSEE